MAWLALARKKVEKMLEEINNHTTNASIEWIYSNLDKLLLSGKATQVNKMLGEIDINQFDFAILFAILFATQQWDKNLPNRKILLNKMREYFISEINEHSADQLLSKFEV